MVFPQHVHRARLVHIVSDQGPSAYSNDHIKCTVSCRGNEPFVARMDMLDASLIVVDLEPDIGNTDANLVGAAIRQETKAMMPADLSGQPASMGGDVNDAIAHGLAVIEAARSVGAVYKGRKSCNLSIIASTSFFSTKTLGCYGFAGVIFSSDDDLAKAIREFRIHWQGRRYVLTRIGVENRMETLQRTVVLAKVEHFDWQVQQRQKAGARNNEPLQVRCQS